MTDLENLGGAVLRKFRNLVLDMLGLRWFPAPKWRCQVNSWICIWNLDEFSELQLPHVIDNYVKGYWNTPVYRSWEA